ncbi:MAG: hypothetical protein IJR65_06115 [Oscillospiraceae bacterium]|nr:hypothetical protein [Oscillospiraceae bacterium]
MTDFLLDLIKAVAIAAIPVCAAYLVRFIDRKSAQVQEQTENEKIKALLAQVTDAVTTAVMFTNQTMVDALKKNGSLSKEDQAAALQLSLDKALSLLSGVAKTALDDIYGDAAAYLTSRIEAEVKNQKSVN